ncbi:hypothetical protein T10_1151 [Trichinella papuae]|uniref:Uncharacterized protein n=1 Tax=Trichinella papuae TaxID=268474 RepID=A0A0V1N0M1_9BILA|nr:hypothetical protein T10_1151 [Trichinella papuae]
MLIAIIMGISEQRINVYAKCLPIAFKKLSFQVMREDFKNNNPIEQCVEVFRIPLKVKLTFLDKSRINLQILMEVEFESQNLLLFLSTLLLLYRLQSTIKQTNANLIYIIKDNRHVSITDKRKLPPTHLA